MEGCTRAGGGAYKYTDKGVDGILVIAVSILCGQKRAPSDAVPVTNYFTRPFQQGGTRTGQGRGIEASSVGFAGHTVKESLEGGNDVSNFVCKCRNNQYFGCLAPDSARAYEERQLVVHE